MENKECIIKKVRNFLGKYIGDRTVSEDESIFGKNIVNSLFSMQLVMFLETEYGLKIENDDLDMKNFYSLNAIATFIEGKVNIRE